MPLLATSYPGGIGGILFGLGGILALILAGVLSLLAIALAGIARTASTADTIGKVAVVVALVSIVCGLISTSMVIYDHLYISHTPADVRRNLIDGGLAVLPNAVSMILAWIACAWAAKTSRRKS